MPKDKPAAAWESFALSFDVSGVVYVMDEDSGEEATPYLYAIRPDGGVFALEMGNGNGGLPWRLGPMPESAHEAIRAEHPELSINFPPIHPPETPGEPPVPAPSLPILRLDPLKVNQVYGGEDVGEIIHLREEVRDGDWDLNVDRRFDEMPVHTALEDLLILERPWEESEFFQATAKKIERGTPKFGCNTVDELRQRGALLQKLADDIRANGFLSRSELGREQLADEVRVGIGRDGRFIFLDGRHRLSIARIFGIEEIPVHVSVRHPLWEEFRAQIRKYATERDGRIYQSIDHPDLRDFPSHHKGERIALLSKALGDYDCAEKRLLDIGAHWGYMSQQMEKRGFVCTAVEANNRCARFAKRIRDATESRFDVWRGDIFDFPDAESQDVVLALNIFHHLIKTEELHQGLIEFLNRLESVELIFFESHIHGSGHMRRASYDYEPQQFAEFVAKHAGLSSVELLGNARDGRALFKIAR